MVLVLSFICNYVVSVWRGFLFLLVLGIGCIIYCGTPWVFHIIYLGLPCIILLQRTMCIRQGFWPPLKPKIESYSTTFSFDCFVK